MDVFRVHGSLVFELRSRGWTLQEIGDHLGVTRERIRQVLNLHFGGTALPYLSSTQAIADELHITSRHFTSLTANLGIKPVHRAASITRWPKATTDVVRAALETHPVCHVCGKPVLPPKKVYCSGACLRESRKDKNRSPEARERHRRTMKVWRERHPGYQAGKGV